MHTNMEEEFFENELAKRFEEMLDNNDEYYFDSEELEEIIIHYLELGDIEFAELASQYAMLLHPNSTELKIKVLEVLLELEKYTDAKKIIDEIKPSSMENLDFLICCAKYYSLLGNPKRSIKYCKKALKYNEEEAFLHNFIADEYFNLEEYTLALEHYREALSRDLYDDYIVEHIMNCYTLLDQQKDALIFLNSYLDKFPYSEIAWIEYGNYFFNKKDYEEAIVGYDYVLAINQNAISVLSNKGSCYEYLDKWEEAIDTYKELLQVDNSQSYTLYKIGMCYKKLKQPNTAIYYIQEALKEAPQFYIGMLQLSNLYEEIGQMDKALQFAEEGAYYDCYNVDFHKRLAYLYINDNKFSEVLPHLAKMTEYEPDEFYNWYIYAEVLMILGEYEKTIETLNSAKKIHENKSEIYYQLSNAYFHLNDTIRGNEALEKALKLNAELLSHMEKKYPFIKKNKNETEKKRNRKTQ